MTTLEGPAKLAYMANQIAQYFAAQPGDHAAQDTCDHLLSFWTPAMRQAIIAYARGGARDLSPAAAQAVALLAEASSAARN